MLREETILHIVKVSGEDPIVSTTDKASRVLFENRVANGLSHKYDFLTVGSMVHNPQLPLVLLSISLSREYGVSTVTVLC